MPTKKPKIEEVAKEFGEAYAEESKWKTTKEKLRKKFFDLIEIPKDDLARQVIYYEGEGHPESYVATLYPKWRILSARKTSGSSEWKVIIEEDPAKKTHVFINPLDKTVYTRTVAESAPGVDMARLKEEDPVLWGEITVQPPLPERELKPLAELDNNQKLKLTAYLTPPKLTNRMEKPRPAKPEELE